MSSTSPTQNAADPEHRWEGLTELEHHVIQHIRRRSPISRDTAQQFYDERTFGERVADRIAEFGGSWTFIFIFLSALAAWVVLNSYILVRRGETFDPYPYILLNLFLSMLAALQAPVIMMSQNRQAARDRLDASHDYEVNLKAELEIVALHQKIDDLREQKWRELILMQQEQIEILQKLTGEGQR